MKTFAKHQTKGFFYLFFFLQMVESEEDSDMDTGFYSDGEEVAPAKRKSLLVALRCVFLLRLS